MKNNDIELFNKYESQVPRYTSYPPVPYWKDDLKQDIWFGHIENTLERKDVSWSLYMHLPFCESLCTFCACNNIITKDHSKEQRYIEALHKEWSLYLDKIPLLKEKFIRQLHLGGGSPTFFSPTSLRLLLSRFFSDLKIDRNQFEASVEVDPRRCTREQLQVLSEFGFNRISLGIQDFDEIVQKNVNRIQPFQLVKECMDNIRSFQFHSVNFDLIYGLPGQTVESIRNTANLVMSLKPDRIAIYSLAVVPWLRPAHNKIVKYEIKYGYEKRLLYESAKDVFIQNGYVQVGMDHFALPDDALAKSYRNHNLHRNFMGYTEYATDVLLGLGVSAISETPESYHQNHKSIDDYYNSLEVKNEIPSYKGHVLSRTDKSVKQNILNLMTHYQTKMSVSKDHFLDMIAEGIVSIENNNICITEKGVPFVRHVCHRIDKYATDKGTSKIFSSGV